MPKPRYGVIPPTRLGDARVIKAKLQKAVGDKAKVLLTIHLGGFCVMIRRYEDTESDLHVFNLHDIPDGIPIIEGERIKRLAKI